MKKAIGLSASLIAGSLLAISAQAQTGPNMYFTVNSSDVMVQGAAMVLATQALEQKANVRVLLCGAAADMALQGHQMPTLKPKDVTPQQMLQGVIKGGATVEVCALFLPNKGLKADALISGVTPGKPADVAAYMLKSDVKMLAF
ncbi:MAG: DsrE family protein [Burkholderiaceae bacterium]|nr:DsrE family protein [Burkholderiaceae bacterium]MCD8516827.1 DsrE family protein [Burkholderiaceae bacterium]MCD8538069.1 DsrE family protein [Burkholderiaceae bacterium]MCD8565426.1 DsrE family protein [Burkholderiaceae bacterium]